MNKYSKGKIYMIITENSSDIYVGSTIKTLKERFNCECGGRYRRGDKAKHFKSLKHKNFTTTN
jgi:lipid A disaccharide synthetase